MTRRFSSWSNLLAIAAVLGLVAPIALVAPPVVKGADTVVSSVNFDDSTIGTWTQDGSPTLSYVDNGTGKALSILRAADYEGIQSPTGLLAEGTTYTFSMQAKLPDGTAGTAPVRFVVKPAYNWVGNTTIDATGWKTVTGTYSLPAGTDLAAVQIYIGSDNLSPAAPYTILIDDILITAPGSAPGGTGVLDSDCSNGYVALTYDDGPYAGQTNLLLTALETAHLRATFFDWGQHIAGNGSLVTAQAANGWVGNHTWDHPHLPTLTEAQITTELTDTQNAIKDITGTAPALMRPPYGETNATVKTVEASLGLTEIIWDVDSQDWNGAKTPAIVAAVRAATNGQIVLMHDNLATTRAAVPLIADAFTATKKCPGMINPATGKAVAPPSQVQINTDFENGMDGWVARNSQGSPTVALTTTEAHSPTHAALVSNRTGQGDGIGHDVTGLMKEGTQYLITAWVKFAAGNATDSMSLSMKRTNGTPAVDTYDTVAAIVDVTSTSWKKVSVKYTMGPATDGAFLYFETTYGQTNINPFLLDDVRVEVFVPSGRDPDLPGLMTTVPFRLGVAVSSADLTGEPAALLLQHFNQVTPENSMKIEAWYDADKNFRMNPEAKAILDFAVANNLPVYGHTLVWHSQVPTWWFNGADGVTPLTSSDADKAFFRTRLQTHITNVAKAISDEYGLFGSSTNPVVAFDAVNEVVSDGTTDPQGLRQSPYYQILGEEYIEDAFNWANQAFNVTYAAPGSNRPVKLTINDYNTDSSGKRQRLHDLVALLLSHNVPVDLVGHQFHISLTTPVQNLDAALAAFEDLPVKQVVSELDVSITDAVDDAKLIEQGYVYRDAFRVFRARATDLFSVTVWGLYDTVSWHATQYPLIFSDSLAAKPAYRGAADSPTLEPRTRAANVFKADVALDSSATTSAEWKKLPLFVFGTGDKVSFQSRWMPDHLSVYVAVKDATIGATDGLTFKVADQTYTVARGQNDATAITTEVAGGWLAVVHLPLSNAQEKDKVQFDVADTDGATVTDWNDANAMGTLTLVEALTFTKVAPTTVAPTIDGVEDPGIWSLSNPAVQTLKQVTGTDTAIGSAKLLYKGNVLYVFMHVVDPVLDDTNSNPWEKDSVEIYVDNMNAKSNGYRVDDMQIRINYKNEVSFGSGDTEANQKARLTSATQIVSDGYVVEAAISLLGGGGVNSYIGLDVQVNDASGGSRKGIRNWADPTNAGYLSPSHWGVALLGTVSGATYVPLTPTRILDTRDGTGLSGLFSNHVARTFAVTGRGGVPLNAVAVTGNMTVTGQTGPGYLFIGPNPSNDPTSSTLNFPVADDRANGVTVGLGAGGTLSVTFVAGAPGAMAHVIFDVTGYFTPDASGATYIALNPARILDTRDGTGLSGPFSNHVARTFAVTGRDGVPLNAIAVTGNLTVTSQTGRGYLFIGPNPTNDPTSSTLNFPVADDRANGVTVGLGAGGTLSVTFVAGAPGPIAHVIFDVTGYFTPEASGATYIALDPVRILDTRNGTGLSLRFSSHAARTFGVAGSDGLPSIAIAVTGNMTVTGQTGRGYLFVGPNPTNDPTSSTLNFPVADDRANGVTVGLGAGGTLSATYAAQTLGATTHVIFDVTGYFVP